MKISIALVLLAAVGTESVIWLWWPYYNHLAGSGSTQPQQPTIEERAQPLAEVNANPDTQVNTQINSAPSETNVEDLEEITTKANIEEATSTEVDTNMQNLNFQTTESNSDVGNAFEKMTLQDPPLEESVSSLPVTELVIETTFQDSPSEENVDSSSVTEPVKEEIAQELSLPQEHKDVEPIVEAQKPTLEPVWIPLFDPNPFALSSKEEEDKVSEEEQRKPSNVLLEKRIEREEKDSTKE